MLELHKLNFAFDIWSGDPELLESGRLSGGERIRAALCSLTSSRYRLALLDEPTNHLDIDSIEALENVLNEYRGSIILVSHDRRFCEIIAPERTIAIYDRKLI